VIVGITTAVWLAVTYATRPVDDQQLVAFYRRVHPGGAGWKRIQAMAPDVQGDHDHVTLFSSWIAGVILVYGALFGVGSLILGDSLKAALFGVVVAAAAWWLNRRVSRIRLIA
jgi:hypothetical protein